MTTVWQRTDGRATTVSRPLSLQRHFTKFAAGSVLATVGQTQVLCTATVQEGVPRFLQGSGEGWLTAEYRLLPSATPERQGRELMKVSGRTAEIQRLIGRSLRAAVDLTLLGPYTITIDADVLQADGGTRTTAITGAYVALADACQQLLAQGAIATWPLQHQVAAISVGLIDRVPYLDLCYEEDVRATVDLNVVMTGSGQLIEVQGTAEGAPFSTGQLHDMLAIATPAIQAWCQQQQDALTT